jgi:hypothetical protein
VTLWAIWHARRKAIHENIFQSPLSVHYFVENFITDLKVVTDMKKKSPGASSTQRQPEWIPPPTGVTKINVDAAVSENNGRGSAAAVARDEAGRFRGASAIIFSGRMTAETLEALACREAVALARDINVRRVRVASDCSNVVDSIQNGSLGVYAHISTNNIATGMVRDR